MPTTEIYCARPHAVVLQRMRETDDGDVVGDPITFNPGEVKKVDEDELEELKEDERFQSLVDNRALKVDPGFSEKGLEREREDLAHNLRSQKWIDHLSAKATDIETIAQEDQRQAERVLSNV